MKFNHILASLALSCAAFGVAAADTVYLVGGDKVVGQYPAESVDYVTFNLPDGVKRLETPSFTFAVGSIQPQEALLAIIPADKEMAYIYGIMRYSKFEGLGATAEALLNFELDFYTGIADMYYDEWYNVARDFASYGDVVENSRLSDSFPYTGEKYIVYAWAFDTTNGDVLIDPEWKEFQFENVEAVDGLTFEVSEVTYSDYSKFKCYPEITITPSSNYDGYLWGVAKAEGVDQTIANVGEQEMAFDLAYTKRDYNDLSADIAEYGISVINQENLPNGLNYNTEYYVVVFGWNYGITTPITKVKFKTPESMPE